MGDARAAKQTQRALGKAMLAETGWELGVTVKIWDAFVLRSDSKSELG